MITIPNPHTDIFLCRTVEGQLITTLRSIAQHHRYGADWGFGATSSHDLALNILHSLLPPAPRPIIFGIPDDWTLEDWEVFEQWQRSIVKVGKGGYVSAEAWRLRYSFHDAFLSYLLIEPGDYRVLPVEDIQRWVARHSETKTELSKP